MGHWWESLEDGSGDLNDEPEDAADGEMEDEPPTWDLASGRANDDERPQHQIDGLTSRQLLDLILDSQWPDGAADGSDHERGYALDVVLKGRDYGLWEAVITAYGEGRTSDGARAIAAIEKVEDARSRGTRDQWLNAPENTVSGARRLTASRGNQTRHSVSPVRVIKPGQRAEWRELGSDAGTVRDHLVERCSAQNVDVTILDWVPSPGRLSKDDSVRYARLALLVCDARDKGATLEAIGEAIGRPKQRIHQLEKAGRRLSEHLSAA